MARLSKDEIVEQIEQITEGEDKDQIITDLSNYFSADELQGLLEHMKEERDFNFF